MCLFWSKEVYSGITRLHNIDTRITTDVKASNAKTVNTMVMKMYYVAFLKKKIYIYNLNGLSNNCIKISDGIINIGPQLVICESRL